LKKIIILTLYYEESSQKQTCEASEKISEVFVSTVSLERRNLRKFIRAVQKFFQE